MTSQRRRALAQRIVACDRCPRLRAHCRQVARSRRRAYRHQEYWGRPVPMFGVVDPRLLVVGLAPGAHGANRTGRIFTGDSSGDWLYRALHESGFANQPESTSVGDGLRLIETVVTCAVRCAPPQNRPSADEIRTCGGYLREELRIYRRLEVVIVLGKIAFDAFLRCWREEKRPELHPKPKFAHGSECATADHRLVLLASYHPSRQNTQTGRLSQTMFQGPFNRARQLLDSRERI